MANQIQENPQDREKAKTIGPIRGLLPFLKPYRHLVVLAFAALVLTAGLSLALPLAVRRVVDNFSIGTGYGAAVLSGDPPW
jgi:ATP-binding cassette, subfamily B, bacterial